MTQMQTTQPRTFASSPLKASSIIGTDVINTAGEDLGDIKDVVIDSTTGRVAYAVVEFGGFLHMGAKLFAIPFSAFAYDHEKNKYVLNESKARLEAAPGFDADKWPALGDEKWNRDVYKYYQRAPYWE
jgi:sporulation protein YlmC with PRC-barrel domain